MKIRQIFEEDIDEGFYKLFVNSLLDWNMHHNRRMMPWKGEKDPYKIWLSEIILQQTRVEQGLMYYENFINNFPTIIHLADAAEEQVFKLWEGLGYYTRCKNLIATAKFIAYDLNGKFPTDYASILALKGVGPYTAAAIASFAYHLPFAVLDGNVYRVLSRIFNIDVPIDTLEGKKLFEAVAQQILPSEQPAAYNQAIMDFGATVCKPQPNCANCFFNLHCKAFLNGNQQALPIKIKQKSSKKRWFHYVVLSYKNSLCGKKANRQRYLGKPARIFIDRRCCTNVSKRNIGAVGKRILYSTKGFKKV